MLQLLLLSQSNKLRQQGLEGAALRKQLAKDLPMLFDLMGYMGDLTKQKLRDEGNRPDVIEACFSNTMFNTDNHPELIELLTELLTGELDAEKEVGPET